MRDFFTFGRARFSPSRVDAAVSLALLRRYKGKGFKKPALEAFLEPFALSEPDSTLHQEGVRARSESEDVELL